MVCRKEQSTIGFSLFLNLGCWLPRSVIEWISGIKMKKIVGCFCGELAQFFAIIRPEKAPLYGLLRSLPHCTCFILDKIGSK
jgi:hypothetical protein